MIQPGLENNQDCDILKQREYAIGKNMARRTSIIIFVGAYLVAISNVVRTIILFWDHQNLVQVAALHGVYLVFLISERLLVRRNPHFTYIYLVVQIVIITKIAYVIYVDHWAGLIPPLIVVAMHNFPYQIGFSITGIFSVIMSYLMLSIRGIKVGFPLVLLNLSGYFLLAAIVAIIHEAIAARDKSQKQKAELQAAHQQLQAYTEQAEELAVLQERNRLARELHDSITQSLHSVTLMAEAGQRLASSGDIEQARGYLIRLGEISQQALREMRLLVYELRPLALLDVGLVGALQQRLDAVERRAGIEVHFSCDDEIEIPEIIEEELYRIAMEALNNSLHHANPTSIEVTLQKKLKHELPCIELSIIDNGVGFDPADKRNKEGFGLSSMRERIEKLGGELEIRSAPGEGTRIIACVNLVGPSEIPPEE